MSYVQAIIFTSVASMSGRKNEPNGLQSFNTEPKQDIQHAWLPKSARAVYLHLPSSHRQTGTVPQHVGSRCR